MRIRTLSALASTFTAPHNRCGVTPEPRSGFVLRELAEATSRIASPLVHARIERLFNPCFGSSRARRAVSPHLLTLGSYE